MLCSCPCLLCDSELGSKAVCLPLPFDCLGELCAASKPFKPCRRSLSVWSTLPPPRQKACQGILPLSVKIVLVAFPASPKKLSGGVTSGFLPSQAKQPKIMPKKEKHAPLNFLRRHHFPGERSRCRTFSP